MKDTDAFVAGVMDKLAAAANGGKNDEPSKAVGVAGVAGGGYAMHKAKPLVTGRSTYYHGTGKDSADKIRRQGIRPGLETGERTAIREGAHPEAWRRKAYAAKGKWKARLYALQAQQAGKGRGEVLKASIPEWKSERLRAQPNPETVGGPKVMADRIKAKQLEAGVPQHIINSPRNERALRMAYRAQVAGGERAFDAIPAEYIKGSKKYQRLSLKEIGQYARARPGRFAGGAALGVLGAGAAIAGARRLFSGEKDRKPQG